MHGQSLIGDDGMAPAVMPPILAGRDLRRSWGSTLLLEHADFLLQEGEKPALVGPNGVGRSTLFQVLVGETKPDLGDLVLKPGLRFGYLLRVPSIRLEIGVRGTRRGLAIPPAC